jgi:hypothetical protein
MALLSTSSDAVRRAFAPIGREVRAASTPHAGSKATPSSSSARDKIAAKSRVHADDQDLGLAIALCGAGRLLWGGGQMVENGVDRAHTLFLGRFRLCVSPIISFSCFGKIENKSFYKIFGFFFCNP